MLPCIWVWINPGWSSHAFLVLQITIQAKTAQKKKIKLCGEPAICNDHLQVSKSWNTGAQP